MFANQSTWTTHIVACRVCCVEELHRKGVGKGLGAKNGQDFWSRDGIGGAD